MSDEGKTNGILDRILTETLEQSKRLGNIEGEQRGTNQHLQQIDARLEMGSSVIRQHGEAIAANEQRAGQLAAAIDQANAEARLRRKRCSDAMRVLGCKIADTGEHQAMQNGASRGKAALWKQLLVVLGLVISACGAFQIGQCRSKAAATNHQRLQQVLSAPAQSGPDSRR